MTTTPHGRNPKHPGGYNWGPDGQASKATTDPYLQMALAAVVYAVQDAKQKENPEKAKRARDWLCSETCALFLEAAGFDPRAAEGWVKSGCPGRIIQRSRIHHKKRTWSTSATGNEEKSHQQVRKYLPTSRSCVCLDIILPSWADEGSADDSN